ncbi:MAG: hypothetical protein HXY19_06375 [Thermoanaerobaculaceae bacterium]|nr:hypothetical protein [Thermoanaerobaculaceae bacterium]
MHEAVERHLLLLRIVAAAYLLTLGALAVIVGVVEPPTPPLLPQSVHLAWALLALAVVNLATLLPVHRAMLAGPQRVFRHSRQLQPLLRAHLVAHLVTYSRVEAVSIFGLVLFLLSGRTDWFWIFAAPAAVGMLVLWPTAEKLEELLGEPTSSL